jgi:hypothetical protein
MSSAVGDLICSTRNLLAQGFRGLPVLLGGAILFMGLTQGNLNLLFFFIGMFVVTPLAAIILNGLLEFIFVKVSIPPALWSVDAATAEACNLFTVKFDAMPSAMNVVPSFWMSMMSFFMFYLFLNAKKLYEFQETSKAPKMAVMARKSQSMIAMIVVCVFALVVTILRYGTSCETGLGVLVSLLMGGFLASGWYKFMRSCGLGRLDDLFGISNRLLPLQSYEEADPTVCVPIAKS